MVASPVPLSETQIGLMEEKAIPHGLTNCGSVVAATPGISDTRFVCVKLLVPSASVRCAPEVTRRIIPRASMMRIALCCLVAMGFLLHTPHRPRIYSHVKSHTTIFLQTICQ